MHGGLAGWDQGPINTRVLQRVVTHPKDRQLALLTPQLPAGSPSAAAPRRLSVSMGVLPMLQFATAFTYYIQGDLSRSIGARPYSLHAIYLHGKDALRKKMALRDAHAWHDPPDYYADPTRRYLTYAPSSAGVVGSTSRHASRVGSSGGFEMLREQLAEFELALWFAQISNRTIILPRLACADKAMAYPCYAWYHRATTHTGFRDAKIPMPDACPTYYWLNANLLERLGVPYRESAFLTNPRTPRWLSAALSTQQLDVRLLGNGRLSGHVPTVRQAVQAFRSHRSDARVLRLVGIGSLPHDAHDAAWRARGAIGGPASAAPAAHARPLGGGLGGVSAISSGFWCTACVITRRGGIIQDNNASTVRELEEFCKAEARGALGLPGEWETCCDVAGKVGGYAQGCPRCARGARKPRDARSLPWSVRRFLPVWANLSSKPRAAASGVSGPSQRSRCLHPLCTGTDPIRYP